MSFLQCVIVLKGVAIAERLAPFKVRKFIYTDVAPRPELASAINAEYGKEDPRTLLYMWTKDPLSTGQMRGRFKGLVKR